MEVSEPRPLNIKDWAAEDRPREKLILKGTGALSDAELIAILIGSGTARLSAVELSKVILMQVNNNLNDLAKRTVKDLTKIKGIGEAKAITIIAALELGRRRKSQEMEEKPTLSTSRTVFEIIQGDLMDLPHEEFWVLLVNRANKFIKKKKISEGGVTGTIADPKIIFKFALEELATGVIIAHNHPSGNNQPSAADVQLTKNISEGGRVLEITVLDHIIVTQHGFYSFADEGLI